MTTHFQPILDKIISSPKRLFLIDGLGAMLTAFLLGVVLTRYEAAFGMPLQNLYFLSIVACFYALYSIGCYFMAPKNWRPFLTAIAIANLLYCWLTSWFVISLFQSLTVLGTLYFLGELLVIGTLIFIELQAVLRNKSSNM